MNGRSIGGTIAALVIGGIIFFVKMGMGDAKVEQFSEETRQEFLAELATTDFYKQGSNANYIDYLVTAAHSQAWENNHEIEYVSRRRSECVIDGPGYARDMFSRMIEIANGESAPHIATELSKVRDDWFPVE